MQVLKPSLELKAGKESIKIVYNGAVLASLNKKVLSDLLADIGIIPGEDNDQKPGKKTKSASDNDLTVRAGQFARAYAKAKKEFYKSKAVKEITPKDKAFTHFIKAAGLVSEHDVSYKVFIQAQIAGLGFVDDGRGIFPKPNQLSTEQAETRLLDYLRTNVIDSYGDQISVVISSADRSTPLGQNAVYMEFLGKIKKGTAALKEAVYVGDLQMIRRKKVSTEVQDYLKEKVK